MSFLDHQEEHGSNDNLVKEKKMPKIEIKLPGGEEYVQINKHQISRNYTDDLGGALLIILDEIAELLMPTKVKTEEGKEEDKLKQECVMIIQSITQLGRSAGIHMVLATQRNDTSILPGVIQSNPLNINTKLIVMRKFGETRNKVVTTMKDLLETDLVQGSDNQWHKIKLLDIHMPIKMYKLTFSSGLSDNYQYLGTVECSYDHHWECFDSEGNSLGEYTTEELSLNPYTISLHIGSPNGPMISQLEEIEPKLSRCIQVDNSDHQFKIILDQLDENESWMYPTKNYSINI